MLQRQKSAEAYVAQDLFKIEEIFEQTLASLADRYGKRIAYFQSLPVIVEQAKACANFAAVAPLGNTPHFLTGACFNAALGCTGGTACTAQAATFWQSNA